MKTWFLLFAVTSLTGACSGRLNSKAPEPKASDEVVPLPVGPGEHRVFVHDNGGSFFDGNLGGVLGADSLCQAEATAQGLSENYKAIISDTNVSAVDRLEITGDVYIYRSSTERVLVAAAGQFWSEGESLQVPMNITSRYTSVPDVVVWTGGYGLGGVNCKDWTSDTPIPDDPFSQLGNGGRTSLSEWDSAGYKKYSNDMAINSVTNVPCNYQVGALYCISQP
jgi:hypothetical protein